ncbi:MAG: dihydropteroate synthase [Planctomycetota bacterium]
MPAAARIGREVPCGRFVLRTGSRTLVMGILNVTPDSFSDQQPGLAGGGRYLDPGLAADRAARMAAEGADLIDVGGESTRPGAGAVPEAEETARVVPVVRRLAASLGVPISIDTSKAAVAEAALGEGASIVNDVTALGDPRMAAVAARGRAGLVLMHMKGTPRTMQQAPEYGDLLAEISGFLEERAGRAAEAGVDPRGIWVDPGIGFGKTVEHNLQLIARASEIGGGRPLLVGPSRKSFLGKVLDLPVGERLEATIAACVVAAWNGADAVRVHDVKECVRALRVADALRQA